MGERTPLVAGNWKMHGSRAMARDLVDGIVAAAPAGVEIAVCPPYPFIAALTAAHPDTALGFGAQDVSEHAASGAFTGEVSAAMLVDIGCRYVIVGHSERRQYHHESSELVAGKFVTAAAAGLQPILCVGETLAERDAGATQSVIAAQLGAVLAAADDAALAGAVIAYEPVWAIGSGRSANAEQVAEVHAFIRSQLAIRDVKLARITRILYGGSVKPDNASGLFALDDVDGGLIGGAALSVPDFVAIAAAASSTKR